ncbi:MIP/aquaporin family protein [Geodermatophilus ruber]|uniref:Glycerol uptake facilitator protein n=1 Tax=Geodermatophilus ruber TaxID=504800 RepID=A0A1I4C6H5_9ACTN|nr:MIP/aquaporin family protein [Geodermatophilus ruber]SFK75701.1 glycerol uptake facilitator protein [Geodermatophilus ruber]
MTAFLRSRPLVGELLAEFAGTFILIMIGLGVVAQVVASGTGDFNSIALAWAFAVTLGVYTAGRISGAHLNPAVTLALAAFRDFPWRKVLPYMSVQVAAAFLAALVVRWNYSEAIAATDPGTTAATQTIFSTLPAEGLDVMGGFRDQVIGTAILVFLVFVLIDARNNPPLSNLAPLIIGFVVLAIGLAYGANAGYAINPARDFGPRLASWLTGYETAWVDGSGTPYWWVPIVAPLLGGLLGAALFELFVGRPLSAHPDFQEVGEVVSDPEPRRVAFHRNVAVSADGDAVARAGDRHDGNTEARTYGRSATNG